MTICELNSYQFQESNQIPSVTASEYLLGYCFVIVSEILSMKKALFCVWAPACVYLMAGVHSSENCNSDPKLCNGLQQADLWEDYIL